MAEPKLSTGTNVRALSGFPSAVLQIAYFGLVAVAVVYGLDLMQYVGHAYYKAQYLAVFLGIMLFAAFLARSAKRRDEPERRVPFYDWIAAVLGLVCGLYPAARWDWVLETIFLRPVQLIVLGTIMLVLLFEATRRVSGWPLVIIGLCFIGYSFTSDHFGDALYAKPIEASRLVTYLYADVNAVLGLPIGIVVSVVIAFVLFGRVLFETGGGKFYTDLAMSLVGRYRGGPAKMAVIASSLFGTLSGSAVSNVVTTGIVTIPLMKRSGFSSVNAGAIEAVASSAGQLTPPVMGAAAFLMAEYLNLPYSDIVLAAIVPVVLYYTCVFLQIEFIAAREGYKGAPPEEIPALPSVLRENGVFLLPLVAIVIGLFALNYRPAKTAYLAVLVTVLIYMFKQRGLGRGYWQMITSTGGSILEVALICGLAGVIIGVLNVTGLGFNVSLLLTNFGGENLFLLLCLAAIMSIILGMGMPTTGVYILLSALIAPSIASLHVEPLSAHMFILYFGVTGYITPPICFAAIAAASIAGASAMRTGIAAVRFAIIAYVVPFLFVYNPGLLLIGEPTRIITDIIVTLAGVVVLSAAMAGYCNGRTLSFVQRGVLIVVAGVLFFYLTPADWQEGAYLVLSAAAAGWIMFGRTGKSRTSDVGHNA